MADSRDVGEDVAIKEMIDAKLFDGNFTLEKAGHHAGYYAVRRIYLDCRGTLAIHPGSGWGSWIVVITWSHDTSTGTTIVEGEDMTRVVDRPVIVDEGAFIGSRAILYNCHIKHHALVACGAVVRNMTVEPYTMVEGNPAKVVKRFINGKWMKATEEVDYLGLLKEHHHLYDSDFNINKVSGKTPKYFWDKQIWVDFRGDLQVHQGAFIGFGVKILTASYTFETGECGNAVSKRVWIDDDCFVGSFSVLYNCWLQHHSVVAAGAVVRNITVPPYSIVEGNPARVTKQFKDGRWVKCT